VALHVDRLSPERDPPRCGEPLLATQAPLGLGDLHTLLDSQPNQVRLELGDPRCADALALLESKQLPDGGFPPEEPNAATADRVASRHSYAEWGPSGQRRSNPLVSLTALGVLQATTQRGR